MPIPLKSQDHPFRSMSVLPYLCNLHYRDAGESDELKLNASMSSSVPDCGDGDCTDDSKLKGKLTFHFIILILFYFSTKFSHE